MPVERVVTGSHPGDDLAAVVKEIEGVGGTVTQVVPCGEEILVIWARGSVRETR